MKYSKCGVVLVTTFNAGNKFPLRLCSQKPISPRQYIPPQSDHENYERTKSLEILYLRKQPNVRTSFGRRVTILSSPIAYYLLYNYRTIKLEKCGRARKLRKWKEARHDTRTYENLTKRIARVAKLSGARSAPIFGIPAMCRRPLVTYPLLTTSHPLSSIPSIDGRITGGILIAIRRSDRYRSGEIYRSPVALPFRD